jgi:ATP-dependent DNA helicase RecQ
VISDQALTALSERRPQGFKGLQQVKGISSYMISRYGEGLLAAIRRGASHPLAWEERVRPNHNADGKANGRPSAACQARFVALRTWRNAAAEARGVEPDIVLTNQTLWAVATRNPRCREDLVRDDLLAGWEVDEFGDELLTVIRKTR